jgi:hypothetical protein
MVATLAAWHMPASSMCTINFFLDVESAAAERDETMLNMAITSSQEKKETPVFTGRFRFNLSSMITSSLVNVSLFTLCPESTMFKEICICVCS